MTFSFTKNYGPWALICGASDGLGAELARKCASKGLNCALVARRKEKLDILKSELEREYGVQARSVPMDLMDEDAVDQIENIANSLSIGLYVINAGGDTIGKRFLESDINARQKFLRRNIELLTESLYNFGIRFQKQKHGGIMVIGSDQAFSGAGRVSLYSASKAYAMNLVESLWTEWRNTKVDIAYMVIGSTKTPKMLGILEHYNVHLTTIDLAEPSDIADWALSNIDQGPTCVFDINPNSMNPLASPTVRRERILRNTQIIDFFYGDLEADETLMANLKSGRNWK